MDIGKFKEWLGLGDESSDDLGAAMEKQIIPEAPTRQRPTNESRSDADKTCLCAEELEGAARDLPGHCQLMKAGQCPSCGDQIVAQAEQPCAWCNTPCRPDKDGFHLVHVALGAFQERHCFCSDECYEAFRRMYPARVHRNCYERSCTECNYCIKRFANESDSFPGQDQSSRPRRAVTPEKE